MIRESRSNIAINMTAKYSVEELLRLRTHSKSEEIIRKISCEAEVKGQSTCAFGLFLLFCFAFILILAVMCDS